ncbi:MAG: DUF2080 family transposase-associated protein [Deltaproteobacteria bacterium]|nr:DUF2080 family transposase-associated protein [Deltaproteobacteria bacterium]
MEKDKETKEEPSDELSKGRVKFVVYGEAMIEKRVRVSGNSGRIYLPPDWVGRYVKIIRID